MVAATKPMNRHPSTEKPVVLLRQLGVVSATALVISNMIGTGIFTTSGFLAADLGDPKLILLIWVVGAAFALFGAFSYSELGVNFPSSGGEYVYLTRAYGPTWGFMTGWASFFAGFSAPIAAAALAFSDYMGYFFPALKQANAQYTLGSGTWALKIGGAQMLASALIILFTLLNCFGVSRVAKIQNVLTLIKILVVVSFVIFGFAMGTGSTDHFSMSAQRTSTTPLVSQFAISLFWIYVSYSGWNAATYVAEELKRPERTLPTALFVGTGLVAAIYVGLNLVFIYATPLETMKGVRCHRFAGRLALVRAGGRRRLQRPDGAFAARHRERHGHHRTARLLRHGEERCISRECRQSASALAHAGLRDRMPGRLLGADDADAVSATRGLYRIHAELFRSAFGGLAVHLPPPSGLAEAACG